MLTNTFQMGWNHQADDHSGLGSLVIRWDKNVMKCMGHDYNKQKSSPEINGLEDEFPYWGFAHFQKQTIILKELLAGGFFDDTSASEHLRKCHF